MDDRHAAATSRLGEHEVEARVVDEDDEVRLIVAEEAEEGRERADDQRDRAENAAESHHRVLGEWKAAVDTCFCEPRAAEAEHLGGSPPLGRAPVPDRSDQMQQVGLTGRLTAGHEDLAAAPAAGGDEARPRRVVVHARGRAVESLGARGEAGVPRRQEGERVQRCSERADQLAREDEGHLEGYRHRHGYSGVRRKARSAAK